MCAILSVVISDPCLIHGCSLTRLPPWAPPLLHLPIQPRTENNQYIPHISKLTQSTSCAIKNELWREEPAEWRKPAHGHSRLKDLSYSGDPYQKFDVHANDGEKDHRAPTTEDVEEFSKLSETSYFQSHMHFDDSVESLVNSDLEDGELEKMLTSPPYAQKASGKADAMVNAGERGKCTIHLQADWKKVWGLIHLKVRKLWGNPLFSSEQENLGILCSETLTRRIWEDLFLKVTRITCFRPGEARISCWIPQ